MHWPANKACNCSLAALLSILHHALAGQHSILRSFHKAGACKGLAILDGDAEDEPMTIEGVS